MGIVNVDDIRGAHKLEGTIICGDCMADEANGYEEISELILDEDIDNNPDFLYRCDECGELL